MRVSSKPLYYRELWTSGPVRDEARRIAREDLKKQFRAKGCDLDLLSEGTINSAVTVLLFNSEAVYLNRAKFNLRR